MTLAAGKPGVKVIVAVVFSPDTVLTLPNVTVALTAVPGTTGAVGTITRVVKSVVWWPKL